MKIGDVVCLKSGSPTMTIVNKKEENSITMCECIWFKTSKIAFGRSKPTDQFDGGYLTGSFPEDALGIG